MEEKKKSTSNVLVRKIRRFFKRLINNIVKGCKNAYSSFMKLKSHVRAIIYVWVIIFFVFVIFLIGSSINNKFVDKYTKIENALSEASLIYVTENDVYPTKSKPVKLSMDMLIADGYLNSVRVTDDTCKGYSSVYYDNTHNEYKITSYVNCKKYTTKGYSK